MWHQQQAMLQEYISFTDSEGMVVTTDTVKVYGLFSVPVEDYTINTSNQEYEHVRQIADGIVKKVTW